MLICRCFLLHKDIGNCAELALLSPFVLRLFPNFSFCLIVASSCNQERVISSRHHLFAFYLYDRPPQALALTASEWSADTHYWSDAIGFFCGSLILLDAEWE